MVYATAYGWCEHISRGEHVWIWIQRIACLKKKKILWENVDSPEHMEIISLSIDSVDFHLSEKSHPTLPRDNKAC